MDKSIRQIYTIFEESFWVGIFEYISEKKRSVYKVMFGAKPKDYGV